jgi:hypothetical protein
MNRIKLGSMVKVYNSDLRAGIHPMKRKVVAFYPHHVDVVDKAGCRECFTYFDMMTFIERGGEQ